MTSTRVQIGITERSWPTSTSLGEVRSAIWYPAEPAPTAAPYLRVYPAAAARDSQPVEGRFPLVVVVAGSGGNRFTYSRLAEGLASRNCWVIAPELPGPPATWAALAQRAAAVEAIRASLATSDLSGYVCGDPIYVGHSIGATLGVLLAGARPDCQHGRWAVESRVGWLSAHMKLSALVLLDPALGDAFSRNALRAVHVPTALFVSGIEDADLFGRPDRYREGLPNVRLTHEFTHAGHFVYCNPCSPVLAKISPRACHDERVDRSAVHRELLSLLDDFLPST